MSNKSLAGSVFPCLEQERRSQTHEKRNASAKTKEISQKSQKTEAK